MAGKCIVDMEKHMQNFINYKVIRSNRKSVALQIKDGKVIVRAPYLMGDVDIDKFVLKNKSWVEKHLKLDSERKRKLDNVEPLTMDDIQKLADKALEVIPKRVAYYAPKVGVTYGRITIRNQKTRWGSCSSKGNLNFNCLLMLTPPEVIDSVVVHELCHRKEMNHSKKFYDEVLRVYPDYRKWDKWLKDNGGLLMERMLKVK